MTLPYSTNSCSIQRVNLIKSRTRMFFNAQVTLHNAQWSIVRYTQVVSYKFTDYSILSL